MLGNVPTAETYRRGRGDVGRLDRRFAALDETHIYEVRDPLHAFRGTRSDRR